MSLLLLHSSFQEASFPKARRAAEDKECVQANMPETYTNQAICIMPGVENTISTTSASGGSASSVVGCVGCEVKCFSRLTNEELPTGKYDGGQQLLDRRAWPLDLCDTSAEVCAPGSRSMPLPCQTQPHNLLELPDQRASAGMLQLSVSKEFWPGSKPSLPTHPQPTRQSE